MASRSHERAQLLPQAQAIVGAGYDIVVQIGQFVGKDAADSIVGSLLTALSKAAS
jgi:hypothetical protein